MALPIKIEIDYTKMMNLRYFITQTRNNYTHSSIYDNTTHDLQLNITFNELGDWIVNAFYQLNYLYDITNSTIPFSVRFLYKFTNDTKSIYETQSIQGLNYTDTHSFISSKVDLNIEAIEPFRIEAFLFVDGASSLNLDAQLKYKQDQNEVVGNTTYTLKIFEGNRTNIEICSS